MRADGRGHPCACRTAPQRVTMCAHAERVCMREDVGDRGGQVACRNRSALTNAILQHEGVVATLADLHRMWEALMDATDVVEPAARRHDRERRSWIATNE